MRCAQGLYWKGPRTRYGMAKPDTLTTALEILGVDGTGPAGFTAARTWGLTTQVPARTELSTVSSRTTADLRGIKVSRRTNGLRRTLNDREIRLLEVLRDTSLMDSGWSGLVDAVTAAANDTFIAPGRLIKPLQGSRWRCATVGRSSNQQ